MGLRSSLTAMARFAASTYGRKPGAVGKSIMGHSVARASWEAGRTSILDSAARGMFALGTAPVAALAYPAFSLAGKSLKVGVAAGKMAGRGALGIGKHLMSRNAAGDLVGARVAKTAAIGAPLIGIPYLLGRRVNQKMRERDQTTMGLSQALYHVHG